MKLAAEVCHQHCIKIAVQTEWGATHSNTGRHVHRNANAPHWRRRIADKRNVQATAPVRKQPERKMITVLFKVILVQTHLLLVVVPYCLL